MYDSESQELDPLPPSKKLRPIESDDYDNLPKGVKETLSNNDCPPSAYWEGTELERKLWRDVANNKWFLWRDEEDLCWSEMWLKYKAETQEDPREGSSHS